MSKVFNIVIKNGSNSLIYKDVRSIDVTSTNGNLIYLYRTCIVANMLVSSSYDESSSGIYVYPPYLIDLMSSFGMSVEKVNYIGLDLDIEISNAPNEPFIKLRELFENVGVLDVLDSLPTITEEQFYDLTLLTE